MRDKIKQVLLFSLLLTAILSSSCTGKRVRPTPIHTSEEIIVDQSLYGPSMSSNEERTFIDVTEKYGLKGVEGTHFYAVDFDGDGHTDLVILPRFFSVPQFYRFDPELARFIHLENSPLDQVERASYLAFFDLNQNGKLDLVMGTLNQRSPLRPRSLRFFEAYKNDLNEMRYRLVDLASPIPPYPTASLAVFDANLNGKLDLFLANWFDESSDPPLPVPDRLFFQESPFEYVDKTQKLIGETEFNRSMRIFPQARPSQGVSICDLNQDGYPDILVSVGSGYENKLWMNRRHQGELRFHDLADFSKFAEDEDGSYLQRGAGHSFFSTCGDYNLNEIFDLVVGEQTFAYDPLSRDRSAILTGNLQGENPQFIRSEFYLDDGSGSWTQSDRRGFFLDINNNGLLDILIENTGHPPRSRLLFLTQAPDHSFHNRADEWGLDVVNPSGSISLDLNQDGRMDLIVGQSNIRDAQIRPRIFVFKNQMKVQGDSIRLYFRGKSANSRGIGVVVRLKTQRWSTVRYHMPHSGYLPSQNEEGLHFGLGENNKIKSIEVTWPILSEEGRPLVRQYNLPHRVNPLRHEILTLCEDGRVIPGRQECYEY